MGFDRLLTQVKGQRKKRETSNNVTRTCPTSTSCNRTCNQRCMLAMPRHGWSSGHAWRPPYAARARGSGADHNPTWQLFTPAWHAPFWSDRALSFQVPSMSAATAGLACVPFWRLASQQRPRRAFQKVSPLHRFTNRICWEASSLLRTPFKVGCDGVNHQTLPPVRSNMLHF